MSTDSAAQILIVEDDEDIQFSLRTVLELEGYRIATANNGREALKYIQDQGMPRLILLDMVMPIMDGWSFAREFYARYAHRIPILVMTAASDAEKRAKDIQANSFVSKPFSIETMIGAVKRYV